MTAARHTPLFPLVRHLSQRVTPLLVRLPISANHVTAASIVAGGACGWAMMQGTRAGALWGAVFLLAAYIFDNCDGEIARIKNQSSEFGRRFDNIADWLVHLIFFPALGVGVYRASGEVLWLWLGAAAALGTSINTLVGFLIERRRKKAGSDGAADKGVRQPEGAKEWAIFVFRELFRADFCFIVLILALVDLTWLLLPAGAVGAQVYWATQMVKGADEFHV
ncbi:MAG: CDP-alcohol phosphatidyltransferase family protein [Rhodospirillales bacterium]|jgi:phosphatidylglycerophosphate synthase|nr:CDP-alcohol phosphatidyltransferase family protein [Rhodospirillales bacterium]